MEEVARAAPPPPARRWPLVPAVVLALVALAEVFARGAIVPPAIQPFVVPVVLLGVGAYLILGPRQPTAQPERSPRAARAVR